MGVDLSGHFGEEKSRIQIIGVGKNIRLFGFLYTPVMNRSVVVQTGLGGEGAAALLAAVGPLQGVLLLKGTFHMRPIY